jgi:protein-tyrosine phosphatase
MPRDPPTLVAEGVFIGSLSTATGGELADKDIKLIYNLSYRRYPSTIPVICFDLEDMDIDDAKRAGKDGEILRALTGGLRSLARRNPSENILIHCAAGVNRSATLIGLYLVSLGWDPRDAIAALTRANMKRRTALLTNKSFERLIYAYSDEYKKLKAERQ